MTTNSWIRMAAAFTVGVILLGGFVPTLASGAEPAPVPMGDNTYSITRKAGFAFLRNTRKLEKEARMDAIDFCASLGRRMKEVSMNSKKASPILGGISEATLIFKALDPSDPEFAGLPAPVTSPSSRVTAAAGEAGPAAPPAGPPAPAVKGEDATQRTLEGISDADLLVELRRRGVLTEAEFEAARQRMAEGAP